MIVMVCFTGAVTIFLNMAQLHHADFDIVFEDEYYLGKDLMDDGSRVLENLRILMKEYKSEEHILSGGTITDDEREWILRELFDEYQFSSKNYNPNLTYEENYEIFLVEYADKIQLKVSERNARLISQELNYYNKILAYLNSLDGIIYYSTDGVNEYTNSTNTSKNFFESRSAYIIYDNSRQTVYPNKITDNPYHYLIDYEFGELSHQDKVYVAFTDNFLNSEIAQWTAQKAFISEKLYILIGLLLGLLISLGYLLLIIGRKAFAEEQVHLNFIDRIYNDINLVMCGFLIMIWFVIMDTIMFRNYKVDEMSVLFLPTFIIGTIGLILVLSLVKHLKNKTFIKHTLIYTVFYKLFKFVKDIYDSGSVAVKVAVAVIAYPLIAAITFFMFPITIGVAVWLTHKKVKDYNALKAGVKRIKDGDIHHTIEVSTKGEFKQLADDINGITEGLSKAVFNELKSERMKTELITNVSHDIRTPLTSIITYVDLLKQENDQSKAKEYIEILDQKSQRLKVLTDDLFEAAKASSGNIPVNYEKIDIVSLISQGLGELDDRIQERSLDFKVTYPDEKLYVNADGKLLWRAIENLLSNIFKYALEGSRVYVDVTNIGSEVTLTIKNISAYELNISSDELMERFARGDESRNSQGSGLGLSIAKSLIEIQKGNFKIEIDGDLFKAVIQMRKLI
jgi:signal transduction histidine kinase